MKESSNVSKCAESHNLYVVRAKGEEMKWKMMKNVTFTRLQKY